MQQGFVRWSCCHVRSRGGGTPPVCNPAPHLGDQGWGGEVTTFNPCPGQRARRRHSQWQISQAVGQKQGRAGVD